MGIGERLFKFRRMAQRDILRSSRPRSPPERRARSQGVDLRSCLETLGFIEGSLRPSGGFLSLPAASLLLMLGLITVTRQSNRCRSLPLLLRIEPATV